MLNLHDGVVFDEPLLTDDAITVGEAVLPPDFERRVRFLDERFVAWGKDVDDEKTPCVEVTVGARQAADLRLGSEQVHK